MSGVTASPAPQITYIIKQAPAKESVKRKYSGRKLNKAKKDTRSLTHLLSDVRFSTQSRRNIGDIVRFNVYGKRKTYQMQKMSKLKQQRHTLCRVQP